MATTSKKSSGSQINQRGITQGNTLVGPRSGLPIDEVVDSNGIRRLAVDAALTLDTVSVNIDDLTPDKDQVSIGDHISGNNMVVNADGSIDVNAKLDASDGDNVAISDGTDTLQINSDGSINVKFNVSTTPTIANVVATLANTEYSYAFPANTAKYKVSARGLSKLKVAFVLGDTSTNYVTVTPGAKLTEENVLLNSTVLYFQATKPLEVVEILSWL